MVTIAECVTQPAIHHKLAMMPKASSSKVIELIIHAVAPTSPKPRSTGSTLQGTQDLARKAVGGTFASCKHVFQIGACAWSRVAPHHKEQ